MSESDEARKQKPYSVEVAITAEPAAVWRALTDEDELRRWFGWDYHGLDEEIRFIFFDHARRSDPHTLVIDDGKAVPARLEVLARGAQTVVRVVCAGNVEGEGWDDVYDDMEEGWRGFFHQLRHYLERHRGQDRRTLFLSGRGSAAAVGEALRVAHDGAVESEGRHLRVFALEGLGGGLAALLSAGPLDDPAPERLSLTLTTYGLDDAVFAALRSSWSARWDDLVEGPSVTP